MIWMIYPGNKFTIVVGGEVNDMIRIVCIYRYTLYIKIKIQVIDHDIYLYIHHNHTV